MKKDDNAQKEMTFFEHLDELRSYIFRSAVAVVIGGILMWYFDDFFVHKVLMGPLHNDFPTYRVLCSIGHQLGFGSKFCMETTSVVMQSTTVGGQFGVFFNIILIGGVILSFPYIFWQFWQFVKPGLTEKEIVGSRGVIFWVSFLFFLGVLFGYFVIAPYSVNFFAKFSIDPSIENRWTISSYFNTLVPIILAAGLAFQLPLVIYFLSRIGVVSVSFLRRNRRYAILIIFILASMITPPDIISPIVCALPLVLLYEISIWLSVGVEKKQKREEMEVWG
jgi:sec-independent protein translocase protein TatC